MNNKFIYAISNLLFVTLLYSCNPAQSPISDLRSLTEDIEENHTSYTTEEWEEVFSTFTSIEEELAQYEYTEEELKEIGRLKGRCLGYITKQSLQEFSEGMESLKNELEGGLEGFMEVFSDETNK